MKRLQRYLWVVLLFFWSGLQGQGIFVIEGDTLKLTAEVRGELSLCWDEGPERPRFFVRRGDRMLELKDSLHNGRAQYQMELERITRDQNPSLGDLEFSLASLGAFVRTYNENAQQQKTQKESQRVFASRIGFFTGLTNNVYADNPDNVLAPLIGLEFEMFNPQFSWRHSVVVDLEQSFKREGYRYTATQLSVGYRYRFVQINRLQFYLDATLGRLLYERDEYQEIDAHGQLLAMRDNSGFKLQAPLSLGIGADYQVTQKGYITFGYNEVVSATLESNGSFPIDITLGYRYQL